MQNKLSVPTDRAELLEEADCTNKLPGAGEGRLWWEERASLWWTDRWSPTGSSSRAGTGLSQ